MVGAVRRYATAAAAGAILALVAFIWLGNRYRLDEETAVR
jgi:hypothetical protein